MPDLDRRSSLIWAYATRQRFLTSFGVSAAPELDNVRQELAYDRIRRTRLLINDKWRVLRRRRLFSVWF